MKSFGILGVDLDENKPGHRGRMSLLGVCFCLAVWPSAARAADSVLVQTNWVEQSITNVVELRMPRNLFITEFHTNWFDQFTTNFVTIYQTNHVNLQTTNWVNKYVTNNAVVSRVRTNSVDLYRTNWIGKTMTNDFLVNRYRTNVIDSYYTNYVTKHVTNVHVASVVHTNVIDDYVTNSTTLQLTNEIVINLVRTNVIDQYRTNWTAKHLTNEIAINVVRTNIVNAYRTNWTTKHLTNEIAINLVRTNFQTVNLTNLQTVVVMKTNRVNQPIQPDPAPDQKAVAATVAAATAPAALVGSAGLAASSSGEEPHFAASRDPRPLVNNQYEITLALKWTAPAPNQIQHWWIEREDGAYLSVGQDRIFRRELPPGNYRVEVKVQHDPDSSVLTLRGTLVVTARDVVIRPKVSTRKLAAN